jgi:hypothetical protein
MKSSSIFLLVVGCVWTVFIVWMFFALAGIADFEWSVSGVLYWLAMLIGPLSLIVGSCLVLIRGTGRFGAVLIAIGCLTLTGDTLYNSIAAIHRQPLQAPPPYSFYIVMLIVMLLADVAGFRVVKQLLRSHGAAH